MKRTTEDSEDESEEAKRSRHDEEPLKDEKDPPSCWICLESSGWKLLRCCACRGSAGLVHEGCMVEANKHRDKSHLTCPTCQQEFFGELRFALAKARVQTTLGEDAEVLADFAHALEEKARFSKAIAVYEKVLSIAGEDFGGDSSFVATTYMNIGIVLSDQGKFDEALIMHHKCLDIMLEIFGPDHTDVAVTYGHIGIVYKNQSKYPKALEMQQKCLIIEEKINGPEHPLVAWTKSNIGAVFQRQGCLEDAEQLYTESLEINLKVFGEDSLNVTDVQKYIAEVRVAQGRYDEAVKIYTDVLQIQERVLGRNHPKVTSVYKNIACVYAKQSKYPEALEILSMCLKNEEAVHEFEHVSVVTTSNIIGEVYRLREYSKAIEMYNKDLEIGVKLLGREHPDVATTQNNIGVLLMVQGKLSEALAMCNMALNTRADVFGPDHPLVADTKNNMERVAAGYDSIGSWQQRREMLPEALEAYEKSLDIRIKIHRLQNVSVTYRNIGALYAKMADYEKALEYRNKEQDMKVHGQNEMGDVTSSKLFMLTNLKNNGNMNGKTVQIVGRTEQRALVHVIGISKSTTNAAVEYSVKLDCLREWTGQGPSLEVAACSARMKWDM